MPSAVSLLTAINVGGRQVKKEELIAIHQAAGCADPRTFIASGNVLFTASEKTLANLAAAIEKEFEKRAGFVSHAVLRTRSELQAALAANPFHAEDGSRNLISFLKEPPSANQIAAAMAIDVSPERLSIRGREMFIFFPNGQGTSRFPVNTIAKALGGIPATGRNRNTVEKLITLLGE